MGSHSRSRARVALERCSERRCGVLRLPRRVLWNSVEWTPGRSIGQTVADPTVFLFLWSLQRPEWVGAGLHVAVCVRFFVGIAFGVGIPAWNSLSVELLPAKWRMFVNGLSFFYWTFGEMYAILLLHLNDPSLKHLEWRSLMILGSIPSFMLFFISLCFLHESPVYLALNGRKEEAHSVLAWMRRHNGKLDVKLDFDVKESNTVSGEEQVKSVFCKKYLCTTLVLSCGCFALNFVYYGGLYAFPQIFADMETLSSTPTISILFGAVCELPGTVAAMVIGTYCPRKLMLCLASFGCAVSLVLFGWGGTLPLDERTDSVDSMMHSAFLSMKTLAMFIFLVLYVYSSEVYPTVVRSTGIAFCIASGRIGAMTSPLVYEKFYEATGNFSAFFFFTGLITFLSGLAACALPETFGQKLQDTADDLEEKRLLE